MDGQPGGGQFVRVEAELPTGEPESHSQEHRVEAPEEQESSRQVSGEVAGATARLLAELGRRIGELEMLARSFPEHEGRVHAALEEAHGRQESLSAELRGDFAALREAFLGHRHDAPEPERDVARTLDNPIQEIDNALGDAIPTPEAPQGEPLKAPRAMRETPVYRSHLHRGR